MCALFAVLLIAGTVALITQNRPKTQTAAAETEGDVPEEPPQASEAQPAEKFLLKLNNGKVCVYRYDNQNELIIATEIEENTLPEADRQTLRQGVVANDNKELTMFLEDFGS